MDNTKKKILSIPQINISTNHKSVTGTWYDDNYFGVSKAFLYEGKDYYINSKIKLKDIKDDIVLVKHTITELVISLYDKESRLYESILGLNCFLTEDLDTKSNSLFRQPSEIWIQKNIIPLVDKDTTHILLKHKVYEPANGSPFLYGSFLELKEAGNDAFKKLSGK